MVWARSHVANAAVWAVNFVMNVRARARLIDVPDVVARGLLIVVNVVVPAYTRMRNVLPVKG